MELLAVKNLSFTYPLCDTPAIHDISFSIRKGEFIVLCGETGCGKSTLLQLLKPELIPNGSQTGEILFKDTPIQELSPEMSASQIGYVMQKPEQQIVTDKVWHELAFGLENLNTPISVIAKRTAEMASYFGVGSWYNKSTSELSGGQKQLLNLSAVMVMHPELLILDEPTAQLDPVSASEFFTAIRKLNQDGLTVIVAEHRLEEVIPMCDRIMMMKDGGMIAIDTPEKAILSVKNETNLLCAMPSVSRLYLELETEGICPLTVRQGREYLSHYDIVHRSLSDAPYQHSDNIALQFEEVFFRYQRNSPDILKGMNLTVYENEIFCILGENGSGKSTALKVTADLLKIYSGSIQVFGKKLKSYKKGALYQNCLAMLPQDVQTLFLRNTVREELEHIEIGQLPFDLQKLSDRHPYDLSGGEQQLLALAKVLHANPKLLLLDEPTKGIDAHSKSKLIQVLRKLKENGMTIIIVTHDLELSAECADRCAMFFHGGIVSADTPKKFFSGNYFYTTPISRMTRDYFDNAVTVEDAVNLCKLNHKKETFS
ncbi:MAG: ATP-binding cassette domain-containing protein [Oscillospiraceae bacterium]